MHRASPYPALVYLGMGTSLLYRPYLYPVELLRVPPWALSSHLRSCPTHASLRPEHFPASCASCDAALASVSSSVPGHPRNDSLSLATASVCCRLPSQAAPSQRPSLSGSGAPRVGAHSLCVMEVSESRVSLFCARKETDATYRFSNQSVSAFWACVLLFFGGQSF